MSKGHLLGVGLIVLGLLVAVGLLNRAPAAAAQSGQPGGQYHVVAGDKAYVLYDTTDSGKSWILFPSNESKRHAWLPIKRLDTEAQIHSWKLTSQARE